jgi:hypothetical protein
MPDLRAQFRTAQDATSVPWNLTLALFVPFFSCGVSTSQMMGTADLSRRFDDRIKEFLAF